MPTVVVIPVLMDILPSGLGCCILEDIMGGIDDTGRSAVATRADSSPKPDVVVGTVSRCPERKK
jgi:hypothetical protein